MSKNTRVFNQTRRFHLTRKQALEAIENCACAWTDESETVLRDLTPAEAREARLKQAETRRRPE